MKPIILLSLCATFSGVPALSAQLEKDAVYTNGWTEARAQKLSNEASKLIRRAGYRCDTMSSFQRWVTKPGFTAVCNQFRYKYYIEDRGGRWTVTLQ